MTVTQVDTKSNVLVRVTGPLIHRCPFRDEEDRGTVTITWPANRLTFELHALRKYLDSFGWKKISHEDITYAISRDLEAKVTTTWDTAGFAVEVFCAP